MHHADIKAELTKAGYSGKRIARQLRLRPSTVSMVIHSKGKSSRVAKKIGSILGKPPSQIWPGRYAEDQPSRPV